MAAFLKAIRAAIATVAVIGVLLVDAAPGSALSHAWGTISAGSAQARVASVTPENQDTAKFSDVPATAQFFTEIQWLSNQGISTGWAQPDGQRLYQPLLPVARDAMAAFMYRLAASPAFSDPSSTPFADIAPSTQFYKEMAWLNEKGISTGWMEHDGSKTYRPLNPVNRDAMAAFMYRLAGSPEFTAPTLSPFVDVPVGTQFYKEITWLASNGITTGWTETNGSKTFRPLASVARDAMAAFMYRFQNLTLAPCTTPSTLTGKLDHDLQLDTRCSKQYVLTGEYTVGKSATLTVPAGTTVTAATGARLKVEGTVLFKGTETAPILLTADARQPAPSLSAAPEALAPLSAGGWGGIQVQWGGKVSATHLQVRNAPTGLTALASPTAEATTRIELEATSISQADVCLSLQGPVVGHFHGSVTDCPTGVTADYPFDASQIQWGTGVGPGDGTDGQPTALGHEINVYPWAGAPPLPPATDTVPDTRDLACGDYYFIGVMGSGERTDVTPDRYLGPRIQDVYTNFRTTIQETKPNAVINAYGIDYPANPVPFSKWTAANIQSLAEYVPGAWQGALNVLDTISLREQKCGSTNEKIVLAGYSQGAWAIHVALNYAEVMDKLNAANEINLNRVSAVGLLADPLRRYDGKEVNLGSAIMGSGIANVLKLGGTLYSFADWAAAHNTRFGLPAPDPNTPMSSMLFGSPIPGSMLARTASFCNENDPVCSWGETANLPDFSIHSYSNTGDRAYLGQWLAQTPTTNAPMGVVATSLPAGIVGQRYHFALKAYDGSPPYTWSLSGSALPAGLYFDSYNGVIAGVPTATGTAAVSIAVKDSSGGSYGPLRTTISVNTPSTSTGTGLSGIKEISSGGNFAILDDGSVWAWGLNNFGQLGNGTTLPSGTAVKVPSLSNVSSITSSNGTAFAVKRDGTVWGWGDNSSQQLGADATIPILPPTQLKLNSVTSVAANAGVAYALKSDGTVFSWGSNNAGLLGRGLDPNAVPYTPDPAQIPGLSVVVKIATDGRSTFAVMADGTVKSWGDNFYHQLGRYTSSAADAAQPEQVPGLSGVTDVVVRQNTSAMTTVVYALTTDGGLWVWGRDAPSGETWTPTQMPEIDHVTQVASNGDTTLAVASGELWSWGWGGHGLLGNGSQKNSAAPLRVPVTGNITSIDISGGSAYASTEDGSLWTWGLNDLGLLGIGNWTTTSHSYEPVKIERLPRILRIVRNYATAFALTVDGRAMAWGFNYNGSTGTGLSGEFVNTPSAIMR